MLIQPYSVLIAIRSSAWEDMQQDIDFRTALMTLSLRLPSLLSESSSCSSRRSREEDMVDYFRTQENQPSLAVQAMLCH